MPYPRLRTAILMLLLAGLMVPATAAAKPVARIALGPSKAKPKKAKAAQACAGADITPTRENLDDVREAIRCLHNEIRAARGLPTLRANGRLRRAALGHSQDMVGRRYFEHTSPGGTTMVDRILRARYATRRQGWAFGENLAWGTGRLSTPRGVMRSWMDSPGHRANVLRRSYRELGVGVVLGIPRGGDDGATYTVDFGVVRR